MKHKVQLTRTTLTSEAVTNIRLYLYNVYSLNYDQLYDILRQVGDELVTSEGKYTKRLFKAIKKAFGVKIDASQVGNIIYKTLGTGNYELEIDDNMIMVEGEFGDEGSCFYSFNAHHLSGMIEDGNFKVIKIWRDGKPFARAWVYLPSDSEMVIFNAYGLQVDHVARMLELLGYNVFQTSLDSNIYVNTGKQFYATLTDNRPNVTGYSAYIEFPNTCTCSDCGYSINEDYDFVYYDDSGNCYCEDCFSENFTYCSSCEEIHPNDDMIYNEDGGFCEYCHSENYTECCECGEYTEQLTELERGEFFSCLTVYVQSGDQIIRL